jgi:hypothetical protein
MHVICGVLTFALYRPSGQRPAADEVVTTQGLPLIWRSRYISDLAVLVASCAIGAALLDYAFKAQATASLARGEPLLRFFGIFYTATSLGTLVIQAFVAPRFLERLGLAATTASLPAALALGGVAVLVAPGLLCLTIVRGAESALRSSLFRSGYELFYTPIPPAEKRSVKTLIDVGGERLGDLAGGGLVKVLLMVLPAAAVPSMVGLALVLGVVGLFSARQLHRGYVRALERRLLDKAAQLELGDNPDRTTRSVFMRTRPDTSLGGLGQPAPGSAPRRASAPRFAVAAKTPSAPGPPTDTIEARRAALRSGDQERVGTALGEELVPALVGDVIPLLGWDEVAARAIAGLRSIAPSVIGQLVDALLDPDTEFSIRRRLPRVLAATHSSRAAEGLFGGLEDKRFEVRYQCGRALSRIHDRVAALGMSPDRVHAAVLREVAVDNSVWTSQRLLDRSDDATDSEFVDDYLRDRADRSLEHVFTLLSLTLPKQPLIIAYRALHTTDEQLRGTALEYLADVLPEPVRASLWPFLEDKRGAPAAPRARDEILAQLMASKESIRLHLGHLRDLTRGDGRR